MEKNKDLDVKKLKKITDKFSKNTKVFMCYMDEENKNSGAVVVGDAVSLAAMISSTLVDVEPLCKMLQIGLSGIDLIKGLKKHGK